MKILDRYIVSSFLKTFTSVFVILFFIFILQGIWLFISELAGKDLDALVVIKFLLFYSPTMVPLVLPLSVLLASIMTFGNLAENYEFAAMKASGISLGRAMRGLMVAIFILSIISFFFANNVIPRAQYKFINLRKNIVQAKPALAIAEGQFNAIGNFNIKVDKKSGDKGQELSGVTIHKRLPSSSNATIIRSESGLLHSSEKSNILQLELFNGYYYEEVTTKNPVERQKLPFVKSSFSKQVMNIDLTKLNSDDMNKERISHTNNMLNINELKYTLDSLESNFKNEKISVSSNITERTNLILTKRQPVNKQIKVNDSIKDITQNIKENSNSSNIVEKEITLNETNSLPLNLLPLIEKEEDKKRVIDLAFNTLNSTDFTINAGINNLKEKKKNINNHWYALYQKFVIAFSCILMFFIGAPLGAIIRKGGLGLPIVFAVIIFIIFHFVNTFGRKLSQEDAISPFMGAWVSSIILSPLAIFLTYRATNDIGLINMDNILLPLQKFVQKLFKLKPKEEN